jgi:hypothetical protein
MMTPVEEMRRRPAGRASSRPAQAQVQARALLMCGRWMRISRRGVSVMAGCLCGFDAAIEVGELDAMVLDYLGDRHAGQAPIEQWIAGFAQPQPGGGVLRLLQALAQAGHGLDARAADAVLDALEPTVASIEEQHL